MKINVNPKSKVKINRISFVGNEAIADAKLKKKMKKTHERPRFSIHRTLMAEVSSINPKTFFTSSHVVTPKELLEFLQRKCET